MMIIMMTTVTFYFITVYTPTYGRSVLKLADIDNLIVTLCVGASNFILLPLGGALSDRVGRRPVLLACTTLCLLTAYAALSWLVAAPSFSRLLMVELWFSVLFGIYNGASIVYLTEIMPPEVRTTGFSLGYSLAVGIFGGFTPAISHYLIDVTGDRAIPGVWMSFAAACALCAALILSSRRADERAAMGAARAAVQN
jgi:MHS family citrate/tricarballylate:H+ symporter-like MFS transporter